MQGVRPSFRNLGNFWVTFGLLSFEPPILKQRVEKFLHLFTGEQESKINSEGKRSEGESKGRKRGNATGKPFPIGSSIRRVLSPPYRLYRGPARSISLHRVAVPIPITRHKLALPPDRQQLRSSGLTPLARSAFASSSNSKRPL
ncbi:hypothetical protein R1flu_005910 [Riccia fluitans]|uniref:Uncharacterized protein n=1 Tax=Riccia fluitans TaxID=41844 RepID=A0ABD1YV33_9MARC